MLCAIIQLESTHMIDPSVRLYMYIHVDYNSTYDCMYYTICTCIIM